METKIKCGMCGRAIEKLGLCEDCGKKTYNEVCQEDDWNYNERVYGDSEDY